MLMMCCPFPHRQAVMKLLVLRLMAWCCGCLLELENQAACSCCCVLPKRLQVAVKVARSAVFVAGRYRKLGRDISNSPWLPGKCATSVSEELARALLPVMRADSYKFNSAGAW